ncbi:unnamed protein product, partial [Acanthoscelides obtectus]
GGSSSQFSSVGTSGAGFLGPYLRNPSRRTGVVSMGVLDPVPADCSPTLCSFNFRAVSAPVYNRLWSSVKFNCLTLSMPPGIVILR